MKLISWNVNGLRSVCKDYNFTAWLVRESPDILCLQEIKVTKDQLPEECKNPPGYFSFFHPAEIKKGYSGVAIYLKRKPDEVNYGIGVEEFDVEGRVITAHFDDLAIISVYVPNGARGPERHAYKMRFLAAFLEYTEYLRKKGFRVVFAGDVNIAHQEIDLASPEENEETSGFREEEREWIDELIGTGYIDSFRHYFPDKERAYTWWNQVRSDRERNLGWRIDYFFVSNELRAHLKGAGIMSSVLGSDHCPVFAELT